MTDDHEFHRAARAVPEINDEWSAQAAQYLLDGFTRAIETLPADTPLRAEFQRDATAIRTRLADWQARQNDPKEQRE